MTIDEILHDYGIDHDNVAAKQQLIVWLEARKIKDNVEYNAVINCLIQQIREGK